MPRVVRILATAAALCVPAAVAAQAASAVLRVRTKTLDGAPLPDVELILFSEVSRPALTGRTDDSGRFTFTFVPDDREYTISARRIGMAAASKKITIHARDTLAIELPLAEAARRLEPVRVDAGLKLARRPYVGGDEIAADTRMIVNLTDVISKLRPEIGYQAHKCFTRSGRTMVGPIRGIPPAELYVNGRWVPGEFGAMRYIKSEHIAEIHFVNCFDKSIDGLPELPWAAFYVSLKPGFKYDLKNGSYADSSMIVRVNDARAADSTRRAQSPSFARVLGVYDEQTGDPIPGVVVADSASGTSALTTATGTVSLVFLPLGTSTLILRRTGYADRSLSVRISPADTNPITLVMTKKR